MRLLWAGLVFALAGIMFWAPGFVKKPGLEQGGDFFSFDDDSSELSESLTPKESSLPMCYMGGWVIKIGEDIREEDRRELKRFLDWYSRQQKENGKSKKLQEEQRPRRRKPPELIMEWTFNA